MDALLVVAVGAAALAGIMASLSILRRERSAEALGDTPFAASTEGEKRCQRCGMGNLWTSSTCASCGEKLAG